jgi:hypothetical protein
MVWNGLYTAFAEHSIARTLHYFSCVLLAASIIISLVLDLLSVVFIAARTWT